MLELIHAHPVMDVMVMDAHNYDYNTHIWLG